MTDVDIIRAGLIKEIEEAFRDVKRGYGVTLHETWVVDAIGSEEEHAAARKLDTDENWQDVPDATIEKYGGECGFLDENGWVYYLPALMTWALRKWGIWNCNALDSMLYFLSDKKYFSLEYSYYVSRLLTLPQKQAVCRFVEYVAIHADEWDGEEASKAWSNYWHQFSQMS